MLLTPSSALLLQTTRRQQQQHGKFCLAGDGDVLRSDRTVRGSQVAGLLHRPDHVQEFGAEGERGGAGRGQEAARSLLPDPLHDPAAALQLRPPGQGADELLRAVESQFQGNFLRHRRRSVQRELRHVLQSGAESEAAAADVGQPGGEAAGRPPGPGRAQRRLPLLSQLPGLCVPAVGAAGRTLGVQPAGTGLSVGAPQTLAAGERQAGSGRGRQTAHTSVPAQGASARAAGPDREGEPRPERGEERSQDAQQSERQRRRGRETQKLHV